MTCTAAYEDFADTHAVGLFEAQFQSVFGIGETHREFIRNDDKGERKVIVTRSCDQHGVLALRSEMVRS